MTLWEQYVNRNNEEHQKQIGRYWASESYSIFKGYTTPRNFFDKKIIDLKGAKNIISGEADEQMLENVLVALDIKHEYNVKKEMDLGGITLVVKPDFIFDNVIIEVKAPEKLTYGIPDKWVWQLECEFRAFEKPVWLGVFRNNPERRFDLSLYFYSPSKERWELIKKTIWEFHKKLLKVGNKHNK